MAASDVIVLQRDGSGHWKEHTLAPTASKVLVTDGSNVVSFSDTVDTLKLTSGLVAPKTSGAAIKVDPASPTYGWKDMIGILRPDTAGGDAPGLNPFIGGNCREFFYSAADRMDMDFHIPHDYVPGTDIYAHAHWSHNGTAISGNMIWRIYYTYAKGHNQANFIAEKTQDITYNTVNIATTPQYRHRIDEIVISSNGGSGTLLDSSTFEVDGVVMISLFANTIPTITGGSPNEPCLFFFDLHYQSTGLPTKQKAPNFYV